MTHEQDFISKIIIMLSDIIYRFAVLATEMSRNMRMLPGPFKLKSSKSGRKTMHDHLHHPWLVSSSFPCPLSDIAIMLSSRMDEFS